MVGIVSDPYVPMPMTCHPFYAAMAESIRQHLHLGNVRVMLPQSVEALMTSSREKPVSDMSVRDAVLTVKKVAGPAPFVGDPIWQDGWYHWKAAVDDMGRHVAGEATLDIVERPMPRR